MNGFGIYFITWILFSAVFQSKVHFFKSTYITCPFNKYDKYFISVPELSLHSMQISHSWKLFTTNIKLSLERERQIRKSLFVLKLSCYQCKIIFGRIHSKNLSNFACRDFCSTNLCVSNSKVSYINKSVNKKNRNWKINYPYL